MYPSKPNGNGEGSNRDSDAQKFSTPSSTSGEKNGAPTDSGYQSSNPSAPLLPSSPYNPNVPNMEPPSYSSVIAQDSSDWKNRSSSFSAGGSNLRPYPPAAPHITGAKSTPGLDNQAPPYPTGPGLPQGATSQAPYPVGGNSSYGPPMQAPYPTGPGAGPGYQSNAPYPAGPGITSQPPYSTGSGYIPGPASQAPYPVAPMPMPAPVDPERPIGFTAPVTTEPKPVNMGYQPEYGQGSTMAQGMQPGLYHPTPAGENSQYIQSSQWGQSAYPQQQQQPNTIYVVQKAPERSTADDDCCLIACCLASCYCICECIKLCASD